MHCGDLPKLAFGSEVMITNGTSEVEDIEDERADDTDKKLEKVPFKYEVAATPDQLVIPR